MYFSMFLKRGKKVKRLFCSCSCAWATFGRQGRTTGSSEILTCSNNNNNNMDQFISWNTFKGNNSESQRPEYTGTIFTALLCKRSLSSVSALVIWYDQSFSVWAAVESGFSELIMQHCWPSLIFACFMMFMHMQCCSKGCVLMFRTAF